ncbi:hypothetical protein [Streptomyces albidoflavus]|uniref:hypothetical protein n=1 Tax=Streptomyces albidoflavus TaxID=1886 RepID=UPI00102275DC|nr:hypothetical protein [Streptomyces albidoflavus]RZF02932.1 hypothetical protein C0R05_32500 [Streptomyces albidoflavus]
MFTAIFTEPVPRNAPGATIPASLGVRTDQIDVFALAVIEHLWRHFADREIVGIEVYLDHATWTGQVRHEDLLLGTFTYARGPHHHRQGDHPHMTNRTPFPRSAVEPPAPADLAGVS